MAAGESSAGASFRGMDVERDAGVLRIGEHLSQGSWLDPADPQGVVIGRRLAQTLDVDVGDELVVLSQAADGSMANDLFRVRGHSAGGRRRHRPLGRVPHGRGVFRELFALPDGAHEIILRRSGEQELGDVAEAVRAIAPGLDVKTWRELMPTLASLIDSTRGMIQMVFFVVYVVIAILVLNAMLMAVFERIREFGVMKAIGVTPATVLGVILVESGLQVGLAVRSGC